MFPMFQFVMLYKVVLTFQIMDEMLSVVIKIKATEHYFPLVVFIIVILLGIVAYFAGLNTLARSDHQSEGRKFSYQPIKKLETFQMFALFSLSVLLTSLASLPALEFVQKKKKWPILSLPSWMKKI